MSMKITSADVATKQRGQIIKKVRITHPFARGHLVAEVVSYKLQLRFFQLFVTTFQVDQKVKVLPTTTKGEAGEKDTMFVDSNGETDSNGSNNDICMSESKVAESEK